VLEQLSCCCCCCCCARENKRTNRGVPGFHKLILKRLESSTGHGVRSSHGIASRLNVLNSITDTVVLLNVTYMHICRHTVHGLYCFFIFFTFCILSFINVNVYLFLHFSILLFLFFTVNILNIVNIMILIRPIQVIFSIVLASELFISLQCVQCVTNKVVESLKQRLFSKFRQPTTSMLYFFQSISNGTGTDAWQQSLNESPPSESGNHHQSLDRRRLPGTTKHRFPSHGSGSRSSAPWLRGYEALRGPRLASRSRGVGNGEICDYNSSESSFRRRSSDAIICSLKAPSLDLRGNQCGVVHFGAVM